jgi:hypothetical protein
MSVRPRPQGQRPGGAAGLAESLIATGNAYGAVEPSWPS